MRRRVILGIIVILLLGLVVGCSAIRGGITSVIPELERPDIRSFTYSWDGVDKGRAKVNVSLLIYNPNSKTIGLSRLKLDAYANDIKIATVSQKGGASLPAYGEGVVNLTAMIDTNQIGAWLVSHIERREASEVRIRGRALVRLDWRAFPFPFTWVGSFKTNILGLLAIGEEKGWGLIAAGINLLSPDITDLMSQNREKIAKLRPISLEQVLSTWGKVTPEYTQINHRVKVHNHTPVEINFRPLSYEILANGIALGEGKLASYSLKPGDNIISLTTTLRNEAVGDWWASHIENKERTMFLVKLKT